jgi:glycosyltransferase involved in cell wall biosynthesis
MKILHVLNHVTRAGNGISNVAVDLAVEQRRQGHDVFIASAGGSPGGSFLDLIAEHAVPHYYVDFAIRRPKQVIRTYRELVAVIRETRPDIVHAHTITPAVLAYLATRRRNSKLVATVHNEYQRGVSLMGLADAVVGVSRAVSDAMAHRGIPRRKIYTVLNGTVGSLRWPPLTQEQIVDLPPHSILTVGAVSHRKGADVLLAAFELVLDKFPQAHLYYVGHVDWSEPAEVARTKGWSDQVHFVGFDVQPRRYFPGASVFVLASRREPLGLVILEALEAGLPVVASDVDGIPEALDGGRAGLLARVDDPADLAEKITSLLGSEEARQDLARAGRERVSTLDVGTMAADYLKIYRFTMTR